MFMSFHFMSTQTIGCLEMCNMQIKFISPFYAQLLQPYKFSCSLIIYRSWWCLECCTCTWCQQTIPVHLKDEKPKPLTGGINKNVNFSIIPVQCMYIKHEKPCLTTFPITEKRVENTMGLFTQLCHWIGLCTVYKPFKKTSNKGTGE